MAPAKIARHINWLLALSWAAVLAVRAVHSLHRNDYRLDVFGLDSCFVTEKGA
jgi:hypothetical protein